MTGNGYTGCSKLVVTVLKKLLATMQKNRCLKVQQAEKYIPFSVIKIVQLEEHREFTVECFIKTKSYMAL